ncbi:hypothetical protein MRB53_021745 [Persea americana]|uniref:Uncharacterized protein n=1 Tax=Persea americana TaxID=3435 RepID=A0ACC2L5W3_PERAE|nr:hypothetical protein MRB53_021745 [Persea americana]
MAKFSYASYLFLVLLVFSTVEAKRELESDGAKRCGITLDPNGCNLSTCKEQCFKEYNGNGECSSNNTGKFNCVCFYNCSPPADPNFTSPVTGHLLPPCLAATPLPASGYGSHPLQRPLPPVPANGHCCHLLSPLLLLPYLCKLSARPATASSPPSAPGRCDLLQIRGHFQTTGHPQTSGHSPYNLHNLLTSWPVHLNPYSAATTAAGHPTCKHPPALAEPAPT